MNQNAENTLEEAAAVAKDADKAAGISRMPNTVPVTTEDGQKHDVIIHRAKVKNLGTVMNVIISLMDSAGIADFSQKSIEDLEARINSPSEMIKLISVANEELVILSSTLSSLSVDEISELELADYVKVIVKVWEVNQKYFFDQVLPALGSLLGNAVQGKPAGTKGKKRR